MNHLCIGMVIGDNQQHHPQQQPQQRQQAQQQQTLTNNRITALQQQNHRRNSTNNLSGSSNSNGGTNNNNTSNKSGNNNNCNTGGACSGTNTNSSNAGNNGVGLIGGSTSAAAAKNQLEQLNTMREALFSQDGWGCQHVNQDTNWEVPSSPEPTNKDPSGGQPIWKPTINNGTDLWELNLRNGGQPPTQPVQKTPWGHTPSSNLGGTWGEDDDGADSSNVWTGSNNPSAAGAVGVASVGSAGVGTGPAVGPQWGQGPVGVGAAGAATGSAAGNISNISSTGATGTSGVNVSGGVNTNTANNAAGNNWDSRELSTSTMGGPIAMRSVDPRDPMRAPSTTEQRDIRILDPRDPIRGDPRGISGRLNGTSEMWGQHHAIQHNQMPTINKMVGPGVGVGSSVAAGTIAAGNVAAIGPGGVNAINSSGVAGNVNTHWGAAPTVGGPKEITALGGKQVTGWEEPSPPPQRRNIPNYDDGTSLWGQQSRVPGGGSHWKDIADPMNRHLIRNSVGNQNASSTVTVLGSGAGGGLGNNQGSGIVTQSVTGNLNNPMGAVGPQGRLGSSVVPGVGVNPHKPDNTMWVHPSNANVSGRSATTWGDDGNHNVGAAAATSWMDDKSNASIGQLGSNVGSANSWNDSGAPWNKNQNKMSTGAASWVSSGTNDTGDLSSEWTSHGGIVGKQQKMGGVNVNVGNINADMIKQSKQFRVLVDSGFKKEDVERALINANMNIEDAAEILRANATIAMDSWRRHDETLGSYADHANSSGGNNFPGRYPATGTQSTMPFPPNNMLSNMSGNTMGVGSNNANLAALNSMPPLQVQKYLSQGPHSVAAGPQPVNQAAVAFGQGTTNVTAVNPATNSNNQPSAQQLRVLVQQIQLAVHNGYLSSQILSEPLPSSMLVLLYQLLTNIKHLQAAQQSLTRGGNSNNTQINFAIAKYKQQIQNLQNQINAQQAYILKQKQQPIPQNPQHPAAHINNSSTEYLRGQHEAITALQSNFSEMNLNKQSSSYSTGPNPQSRLNQWKLPLEKDISSDNTDFSRAPGTTKQNLSGTAASSMCPLGLQNDGTWSTGRNISDGWPDPSADNENKDWSVAQPPSATAYTDLVQEFEPGKPWKGSQIKSIEDDPSITPGSVARSPLSINSTPKEADIFANPSKNSPTDLTPLSLSSSTWSFNPSSNNQNFPSWSDNAQQCATSELWAINKTSRGPPPGLGSNKSCNIAVAGVPSATNSSSVGAGSSNGWIVGGSRGASNTNSAWTGTNANWNSTWLLLKNLTAQIDGSTLRTLCMQHGPLVNFQLFLNQGIALCKYATREEANKAQMTLNNCVLGNTTICAESPSENEVQSILQHLPQSANTVTSAANNSNVGGGNGNSGPSGGSGGTTGSMTSNSGNNNGGAGNGGSGNGNVSGNSVNSNSGNNATTPTNSSNGSNSQTHTGTGACSSNGNNGTAVSGNGANSNANNVTPGGNNVIGATAWRQNQQNQSRPSGRDEYDYISKYVCSIVDD